MSTRLAPSLHRWGPIGHLCPTTDPPLLLTNQPNSMTWKKNGERHQEVRSTYVGCLSRNLDQLVQNDSTKCAFLFVCFCHRKEGKLFLHYVCLSCWRRQEKREFCLCLALYVAMTEIPHFLISQAWVKWARRSHLVTWKCEARREIVMMRHSGVKWSIF